MNSMKLRVAFLGTPDFAIPSLEALHEAGHDIVAVYTQPPRPKGRGHHLQKSPVHLLAETYGVPIFTPQTLKDPLEQQRFAELQLDLAVVVAYGLLLPPAILASPRFGCINVHASLLPRWRGAAPIQRAILAGDEKTGVTIMLMDAGLDTGPMLARHAIPLTLSTTSTALYVQLAKLGAAGLCPALEDLAAGKCQPIPQPTEGVTLAPKLTHEDGHLDWHQDAANLERSVRALTPWPGTWFEHEGARIKVREAVCVPDTTVAAADSNIVLPSGTPMAAPSSDIPVGTIIDDQITVACSKGYLRLTKLQRPGGQALINKDFLNGYPLSKGTRL